MIEDDFAFLSAKNLRCDKTIKEIIQDVITKINSISFKNNIVSIILVGGMARGEGSAIQKNDKTIIFSDFDFVVVFRDKTDQETRYLLEKIGQTLTKKYMQRNVLKANIDIAVSSLNSFLKPRPAIFTYELKETGKVLYGKDIIKDFPELSSADIPQEDILQLLFNRMADLCLYYPKPYPDEKLEMNIYLISKTILDSCGALLAAYGAYKPTYQQRAEEIEKLFYANPELSEEFPNFPKVIQLWTDFKMYPDVQMLYQNNEKSLYDFAIDLWYDARRYITAVWTHIMRNKLKIRNFETNNIALATKYYTSSRSIKRTLYNLIKLIMHKQPNTTSKIGVDPLASANCANFLTLCSVPKKKNSTDISNMELEHFKKYIQESTKYLKYAGSEFEINEEVGVKSLFKVWEAIRKETYLTWSKYFWHEGVAKRWVKDW